MKTSDWVWVILLDNQVRFIFPCKIVTKKEVLSRVGLFEVDSWKEARKQGWRCKKAKLVYRGESK
jgi:hypothetical protein